MTTFCQKKEEGSPIGEDSDDDDDDGWMVYKWKAMSVEPNRECRRRNGKFRARPFTPWRGIEFYVEAATRRHPQRVKRPLLDGPDPGPAGLTAHLVSLVLALCPW